MDPNNEFKGFTLRDRGFEKYRCERCGTVFWSKTPRKTCPDRPCSKYEFLYKEYPSTQSLSVEDAREKFITFFKQKGHIYIDPYPVLARWRNDLYLTIASIVVFQPMVTEGLIEPPANPLVIVQPSVRLEDIDYVGFTFGRHLTSFEMGGHHAFNKGDKWIYWIKETVEYALDFFVNVIGIPEENIVFKESWWEGGGNAGPAFEVLVDGMELATLVFMKYRVIDNRYELNPVYVVDTGYGIERIAWFTQRKPTSYHVIFSDLINQYSDLLGTELPPDHVLKRVVYELSDKDIRSSEDLMLWIERLKLKEYSRELISSINVFTLLDHGKTTLLLLSDGIVPSNTGEGYLARLIIRRLLRTLLRLKVDISNLESIVLSLLEKQLEYWRNKYVYGKFVNYRDYVYDVISLETRKFVDSITRGVVVVDKIIKRKKQIGQEDLVEIYDSHGIPPEIVAERALKHGVRIKIPSDFYAKIAAKHGGSRVLVKEKQLELPEKIRKWAENKPTTKPLFHVDPYMKKCSSKVIDVNGKYVIFDQTIFYPKAGGQDHDTGYVVFGNEEYRVLKVFKVGDVIVHEIDREPIFSKGSEVLMQIDWLRRYMLMRHHTATHILLGILRRLLGDHVWQAGVEKTVEKARLDITHYRPLSEEEIRKVEKEANRVIDQYIAVQSRYMKKFDAENRYGMRIYQGGAIYSPILRIVEIPGVDVEACFGTHVRNTGEVGGIKIIKTEKIQDGIIRIEFTVATRIPEYLSELTTAHTNVARILGEPHGDPVIVAKKAKKQLDNYKELLSSYRRIYGDLVIKNAIDKALDFCGIKVATIERILLDEQLYKNIIEELSFRKKYLVVLYSNNYVEVAVNPGLSKEKTIDLKLLINELKKIIPELKGGGKSDHIFMHLANVRDKMHLILGTLERIVCRQ